MLFCMQDFNAIINCEDEIFSFLLTNNYQFELLREKKEEQLINFEWLFFPCSIYSIIYKQFRRISSSDRWPEWCRWYIGSFMG